MLFVDFILDKEKVYYVSELSICNIYIIREYQLESYYIVLFYTSLNNILILVLYVASAHNKFGLNHITNS